MPIKMPIQLELESPKQQPAVNDVIRCARCSRMWAMVAVDDKGMMSVLPAAGSVQVDWSSSWCSACATPDEHQRGAKFTHATEQPTAPPFVLLHGQIMEMSTVLIDALGPHAIMLGTWLADPNRFEMFDADWWNGESDRSKHRESIALAYGYLLGVANAARVSIEILIDAHRHYRARASRPEIAAVALNDDGTASPIDASGQPLEPRARNEAEHRHRIRALSEHPAIWQVAQEHAIALTEERPDVMLEYVRTSGRTDWVFTEERLSSMLDKTEFRALNEVDRAPYVAAFSIVVAWIQLRHPNVKPPAWFTREMGHVQ